MKSRWNPDEAARLGDDPLALRVYTSRLLGADPALVLHGGGNTSVKADVQDLFGETIQVLHVKGSGWDLATIEAPGFAPVRLDVLRRMAELDTLSDSDMVKHQRAAMLDPSAPTPSVEAILHAILPFRFVDHSHADAVVTLTNTAEGERRVRDLYGERVLIVPYVMPGFVLAKQIHDMTRDADWSAIDGMVLMNHGLFTFHDDPKLSYERHVEFVDKAERCLAQLGGAVPAGPTQPATLQDADLVQLARLRRAVSRARGAAVLTALDDRPATLRFTALPDVADVGTRGLLTPDHVIRTKRTPLIVGERPGADVDDYVASYNQYFERHADDSLTRLDPAPRWALWPGHGALAFGRSPKELRILQDITEHTMEAIERAEAVDRWSTLGERDIFEVEYWELEQAKLKKAGPAPPLAGRVALVTGGGGGIGAACVRSLRARGAVVAALDVSESVVETFAPDDGVLGLVADVTDDGALRAAIVETVRRFGGLDIVISNAGTFPPSQSLAEMDPDVWRRSLALNLDAHQRLLQHSIPFLGHGLEPAVVIVASKNVPAPGPGAGAYSVAKAGLTQLARVAALELGPRGIRVNVLHPNAVFDTGIWTEEVLAERAARYGLSVEDYRRNNVLGVEVTSEDVAEMACALAGPLFSRTTGAQIPVDGGNDRVI